MQKVHKVHNKDIKFYYELITIKENAKLALYDSNKKSLGIINYNKETSKRTLEEWLCGYLTFFSSTDKVDNLLDNLPFESKVVEKTDYYTNIILQGSTPIYIDIYDNTPIFD